MARRLPTLLLTGSLTLALAGAAANAPVAAAPEPGAPPSERAAPVIQVGTAPLPGTPAVSPGLNGGNLRWFGRADGVLTQDRTLDDNTSRLMSDTGLGSIRYAGGTVANLFDHTSFAAGRCQTSGGFAYDKFAAIPPRGNRYSPQMHHQFLEKVAGTQQTTVMVPMINTTPADAVAYLKKMRLPSDTGTLHVEIGNEPYLDGQRYWRSPQEGRRLTQYINGGYQEQAATKKGDYQHNLGLFKVNGCNLRTPAVADGTPRQTYRPRFTPIKPGSKVVVRVRGKVWKQVGAFKKHGPRAKVFRLDKTRSRVVFGNGKRGAKPRGKMTIAYTVGRAPGFVDFYRAIKKEIPRVRVCSSWATSGFVKQMGKRRYDCLAVHSYAEVRGATTATAAYDVVRRQGDALSADLLRLRRQMQAAGGDGAAERFLNVTEYGTIKSTYPGHGKRFLNDLLLARLVMGQIRAGAQIGSISNFDRLMEKLPKTHTRVLSSRAYLLQLVTLMQGQQPRKVRATSANGVHVLATTDGDTAQLMVLNTRGSAGYQPTVRVPGGDGARCVVERRMRGALSTPTRATAADALPPTLSMAGRRVTGSSFDASFPAHSLTFLTVSPAAGDCSPGSWLPPTGATRQVTSAR